MFKACRLEDIVYVVTDKTSSEKDEMLPYVGLEHLRQRGGGLKGWSPATNSISINTIFKAGDVLFGKLRPNLRKSALAPFDGYCSTDILVLRPKEGISSRFAAKVFQSERVGAAAEMTAAGTKMPRTSWNALRALEVYCPAIESQESLADVLDTLDTTILQTEVIVEKLNLVRQGLLNDLLTRGIDADGELRLPQSLAPHLYKDSPLGAIPNGWRQVPLGDVLVGIDGGWSPECIEQPPNDGQWGVLKVSAISSGTYNSSESKTLPSHLQPNPSIEVGVGDVLLARANGVADLVAVTAYVDATPPHLMLSDKTLRLRPKTNSLSGRFLATLMSFHTTRRQIGGMLNGSSGQRNISQRQIADLLIALPPLPEQMHINQRLSSVAERIVLEMAVLEKLQRQKIGLMDDLITGRVRVIPLLDTVEV